MAAESRARVDQVCGRVHTASSTQAGGLALEAGLGAVPSLLQDLGALSLLWNAFTVPLRAPPPPFRLD